MDTTLVLPSELTIYTVAELRPQWMAWLNDALPSADTDGERTTVQAAGVDEVDGAGLQMLLALATALVERGRRLHLDSPSLALSDACRALGIGQILPVGQASPAQPLPMAGDVS